MAEPGVLFQNVSKKFQRGERHDSFRDLIPSMVRRMTGRPPVGVDPTRREFWALRDVSFEVRPGEALGIIGSNGAGKSTILKLLTKILRPTTGTTELRGRVGALIEVAAGFHPDLSGRENVYLQGAIMGMKRAEIARKFDQIVDFSGVSEFIDTPVKRYSSGMNARLGFAIAAHLDPDVLLIDEVLSVGDAAFEEKCVAHMRTLIARGLPLIFISHHLPAVVELCTRTIVLERGQIKFDGNPAEAVGKYRSAPPVQHDAPHPLSPIWIKRAELLDYRGEPSNTYRTGDPIAIRVHYETKEPVDAPQFAVDIHRADGLYCAGINTRISGHRVGLIQGGGHIDLTIPSLPLLAGCYLVSVGILHGSLMTPYDVHLRAYPFSVSSHSRQVGVLHLEHSWDLQTASRPSSPGDTRSVASIR